MPESEFYGRKDFAHFASPALPMNSVVVLHSLLPPLHPLVRVLVPASQVHHSGLWMFHLSYIACNATTTTQEDKKQVHLVLDLELVSFAPIVDGGCREEDREGRTSPQ